MREIETELLTTALRCFESGQGLDEARRQARERLAARYFWKACGLGARAEMAGLAVQASPRRK